MPPDRYPLPVAAGAAAAAAVVAYPLFFLVYGFMEYINASPMRLVRDWPSESQDFLWVSLRIPVPFALLAAIGVFGVLRQPAERWRLLGHRLFRFLQLTLCGCALCALLLGAGTVGEVDEADAKVAAVLLFVILAGVIVTFPIDRNIPATLCLFVAAVPIWVAGVVVIRIVYLGITACIWLVVRGSS